MFEIEGSLAVVQARAFFVVLSIVRVVERGCPERSMMLATVVDRVQ